jgi:hypothetical protein
LLKEQLSEERSQTPQLLLAMEAKKLNRNRAFYFREICPRISGKKQQASDEEGSSGHLIKDPEHLPQRMVPQEIILPAKVHDGAPSGTICSAHFAVMKESLF